MSEKENVPNSTRELVSNPTEENLDEGVKSIERKPSGGDEIS